MASRHNLTSNTDCYLAEIGHEKAQSVIDSITSSYAAEGQSSSNPMLGQNPGVNPPPPFAFPGGTSPPFPYLFRHKLTNTLLQVSHLHPSACLGCLQCPLPGGLPQGIIPPPGGRGMPMPPFPGGPGMPPLPQGMPFPPPGALPPNFQFPPLPGGFQPPPGFPPLPGAPSAGFDAQNQGQQGGQGQGERR
jgi:U1 small nuclear ribonucleoprotein C